MSMVVSTWERYIPTMHKLVDRIVSTLVAALAMLALTSCGESKQAAPSPSPSSSPSSGLTVAASTPVQPCGLISKGDLIEWQSNRHRPYADGETGLPPRAARIGDIDLAHCRSALGGWEQVHEDNDADTAAGYRDCYEIAWADDNPGYDVDARPAPRLKHVIAQAGNDC
jgi:hypothetical protein